MDIGLFEAINTVFFLMKKAMITPNCYHTDLKFVQLLFMKILLVSLIIMMKI